MSKATDPVTEAACLLIHAWTPPGTVIPLSLAQCEELARRLDVDNYRFPKDVVASLLATVLVLVLANGGEPAGAW